MRQMLGTRSSLSPVPGYRYRTHFEKHQADRLIALLARIELSTLQGNKL